MFEFTCLDSHGNSIDKFTQWDVNQKIYMTISGFDIEYLYFRVHFCNLKSDQALVVKPEVTKDSNTKKLTIEADVPNALLTEPYPLLVYINLYYADGVTDEDIKLDDSKASRRVILQTEIPVRKRAMPGDYLYFENVEITSLENIVIDVVRQLRLITESDGNGNVTMRLGGV